MERTLEIWKIHTKYLVYGCLSSFLGGGSGGGAFVNIGVFLGEMCIES
jgi:hypothetical protein